MSKLPKNSTLDQSIDFSARMYSSTADQYADYLRGEYEENYNDSTLSWDKHFENARANFNGLIMDLLNKGTKFSEMNIAIVGPGLRPVGRELGNTAATKILPRARSLVVADFLPYAVQESATQISSEVNMRNTPILPMIIDITDGFSTAYRKMITGDMQNVDNEEQLCEVAKKYDAMDVAQLDERLTQILAEINYDTFESPEIAHSIYPEVFQGGGLNMQKERYQLSVNNGDPLPLHAIYLPMVIAGTGAAAEHAIWETYLTVTSDTERGAKPETEETIADREVMIRQFYNLITRYNTMTASRAIGQMLADNPQATLLAISDVSTVLYQYDIGVVPRLNPTDLRDSLRKIGVSMKQDGLDWEWHDEPEHYHGVNAFTFSKAQKSPQPGDSGVIEVLQENAGESTPDGSDDSEEVDGQEATT